MTHFLAVFPACLSMLLESYLVVLLLRGPYRKYLVFFFYILGQLIGDSLEAFAFYHGGPRTTSYRNFYWSDEITAALMLFIVVITFTYEALKDSPLRPKAGKILAVIAVLTLVSPFVLFHSRVLSDRWFNSADQLLNFGAAIMNLVLWGALLSNRHRDQQLLNISMGVGIAATSAAMMWGARRWVSDAHRWPMDTFAVLMHAASLLLWCWVFRPKPARAGAPPKPATLPVNSSY